MSQDSRKGQVLGKRELFAEPGNSRKRSERRCVKWWGDGDMIRTIEK